MADGKLIAFVGGVSAGAGVVNPNLQRASIVRTISRTVASVVAESTSVAFFGCVGDGVTNDAAAFQEACNTMAVNGGWLRIPGGFNLYIGGASISIPGNLRLIGDGSGLSKITGNGSLGAGSGMLDLNGVSNVDLIGFGIEGAVTTPAGILYSSAGDPSNAQWTTGTSIWIHTGSSNIDIEDVDINHTGGYAIYWYGNVNGLSIIRPSIRNSRPCVLGITADLNYFGWNGGIFGASDGTSNFFQDIDIVDAFFQNLTGHCFWTRASSLPSVPMMNRRVSFTADAEDCLGDVAQPGDIDTYFENFTARRVGFICTNGATSGFTTTGVLVDSTPTATRVPKWLAAGGYNVPATAADTTGLLLNADRRFTVDGVNGGLGSGDGMGGSKVTCVGTSAFYSTDPLINVSICGPAGNGINFCSGFVMSNSNNLAAAGQNIDLSGEFNGFGFISVGFYATRYSSISDCVIRAPIVSGQVSPIMLGCIGTHGVIGGPYQRAYNVKVFGCHVEWPASGGSAVGEDSSYGSFQSGDTNWIDSSNTFTCGSLYFKDPITNTTTGGILHTTVTPAAAQSVVGTVLQSEGRLTALTDHAFKAYRTDGALILTSTLATLTVASLTLPGAAAPTVLDAVANAAVNSVTVNGASLPLVVDSVGNAFVRSLSVGQLLPYDLITNSHLDAVDAQGTPVGSTHGSGMLLRSSALGYMVAVENLDNATNANGLLMKVANTNALTRLLTLNANGSDLFAVTANGFATAQAYSIGTTGVISNSRDFFGDSLSVGSTPTIAASAAGLAIANDRSAYLSQVYIGANGASPTLVIDNTGAFVGAFNPSTIALGTFSYLSTESHSFAIHGNGALDDTNDRSPAAFLLGVSATSIRTVENHIYPAGTPGVLSREAAVSVGVIVPSSSTNWETDGIIVRAVSQCNTSAVVAGSFFSVAAVTGAVVWAQNWRVVDFDNFNEATNYAATIIGVEVDIAAANPNTDASGINLGLYSPALRSLYTTSMDAVRINLTGTNVGTGGHYNYFDRGIAFAPGSCNVAIEIGLAPAVFGTNSQFLNFISSGGAGTYTAKMYASSFGYVVIQANTGNVGNTLPANTYPFLLSPFGTASCHVISADTGFQINATTTVIDASTNFFGNSLSIDPPLWIGAFHAYTLGQQYLDSNGNIQIVVVAGTGSNTHPTWNVTTGGNTTDNGATWKNLGVPLVIDNSRNASFNSLTQVSPVTGVRSLSIDNTNTANFAQVKVASTVVIDGGLNCGFALATLVGLQVGLPTGGAPVGYVNTTNGYQVNGTVVIDHTGAFVGTIGTGSFGTINVNYIIKPADSGYEWWQTGYSNGTYWQVVRRQIATPNAATYALTLQTPNGYVGVLNPSPAYQLDVVGVAFASTGFRSDAVFGNALNLTNGGVTAQTATINSTAYNAIQVTGGVSIGGCVYIANTTAPAGLDLASKVEIHGNGASGSGGRAYYTAIDSTGATTGYFGVTSGGAFMGTDSSSSFGVRTVNTDRIVIDTSGRVAIAAFAVLPGSIWNGTVPELQVAGVCYASLGFDCNSQGIGCGGINPYGGHVGQSVSVVFPGGFTVGGSTFHNLTFVGGVLVTWS